MYKKYTLTDNEGEILDVQYVSNKMNIYVLINPLYCLEKEYLRWIPIINFIMFGVLKLVNASMEILPYISSVGLLYGCVCYSRLFTNYLDKKGYEFEKNVQEKF